MGTKCSRQRCSHPARVGRWCRSHATHEADRRYSLFIRDRDGGCVRCFAAQNLQCAHLVSRSYRATRWVPRNAVTLCMGCHVYFTNRPLEWEEWCDERWPNRLYRLKRWALRGWVPELETVLNHYTGGQPGGAASAGSGMDG